jgi:hypothetical protein
MNDYRPAVKLAERDDEAEPFRLKAIPLYGAVAFEVEG